MANQRDTDKGSKELLKQTAQEMNHPETREEIKQARLRELRRIQALVE